LQQRSTKPWVDHEIVSRDIFEALLKQDAVQNLEVRRQVTIIGKSTAVIAIDVYWKFTVGPEEYFTVVEVKRKKRKVTQGEMFAFKAILDDIPGRPKGVFVSQRGYQTGALRVAEHYNIKLYELSEVTNRNPISLTNISVAEFKIRPEILSWEWTLYYTLFENGGITLDAKWAQENNITALPVKFELTDVAKIEFTTSGHGTVKLQNLIRNIVKEHKKSGRVPFNFPVTEPTTMSGIAIFTDDGRRLESVIIVAFHGDIVIEERVRVSPFFDVKDSGNRFFRLRNLDSKEYQHVNVAEDGVQISMKLVGIGG